MSMAADIGPVSAHQDILYMPGRCRAEACTAQSRTVDRSENLLCCSSTAERIHTLYACFPSHRSTISLARSLVQDSGKKVFMQLQEQKERFPWNLEGYAVSP